MILPSKYGLAPTSPEAYAALTVDDLVNAVGKEALHADGPLTNEYLGMLSLYALKRGVMVYDEKQPYYNLVKLSYDSFDPSQLSADLIRCLTDIITQENKS